MTSVQTAAYLKCANLGLERIWRAQILGLLLISHDIREKADDALKPSERMSLERQFILKFIIYVRSVHTDEIHLLRATASIRGRRQGWMNRTQKMVLVARGGRFSQIKSSALTLYSG